MQGSEQSAKDGGAPPESTSGAPVTATLDSIAAPLLGAMPTPNTAAIEAHEREQADRAARWGDLRDRDGAPFDPATHVTNADGEPVLSASGKLRRRPGRKAGQGNAGTGARPGIVSTIGNGQHEGTSQSGDAQAKIEAAAAGVFAAQTLIALSVGLGGDEWAPVKDPSLGVDEESYLQTAFANYFQAKGMRDVPPGVALSMALGMYCLPRFRKPKTRGKLQRLKEGIAAWYARRKVRGNGSQSNSRDQRTRENDASEKSAGKVSRGRD